MVFTIPHLLNELNLAFPRQLYTLLFKAAWETLDEFGWNRKYLGAQIGATMVLHTWGSNLSYHPHVHCIVPGGGVTMNGKWKAIPPKGKYLFPVKALSQVFRGKYMKYLINFMVEAGMDLGDLQSKLYKHQWVVYAKPPPSKLGLIGYLARYTHQIAITQSRIRSHSPEQVVYSYKDYRHSTQKKIMSVTAWEFVRRFAQHILPHGFTRIRHFGILHSSWNRLLFPNMPPYTSTWIEFWANRDLNVTLCPVCKRGQLCVVAEIPPQRGPPVLTDTDPLQN